MNSPCHIPFRLEILLYMENMNAGFIAEGLTATDRAIAAYMKTKGTDDDQKALKLLKELEGAMHGAWDEQTMLGASRLRKELGQLVGETPKGPLDLKCPEASPLALLGMARYALDPRFEFYSPLHAMTYLGKALLLGCNAVVGPMTDLLLDERVTPDCVDLALGIKITTLVESLLDAPSEDFLLVAGQRIARWDVLEENQASPIRKGLMRLAEQGHVDALRLLALSHAPDVAPETIWARGEILAQASQGKSHALLVQAQHLANLLHFWPADGDCEENMARARTLFERLASQNDPWAGLALAWSLLPSGSGKPNQPNQPNQPNRDEKRALEILERLAHEQQFAPARAMIGVLHYQKGDPERAWPLLREACLQCFSWPCEAACADFLVGMTLHARLVKALRQHPFAQLPGFNASIAKIDTNDYGGSKRWVDASLSFGDARLFGPLPLNCLSMMVHDMVRHGGLTTFDPDYSRKLAATYQGQVAVFVHLLALGQEETPDNLKWREILTMFMTASGAHGNEASLLGSIFFVNDPDTKSFRSWDLRNIARLCAAKWPATNLARATVSLVRLLSLFEEEREKGEDVQRREAEQDLSTLAEEHARARMVNDIPFLCLLPVLFKMAETAFPAKVVRDVLHFVSNHLKDRKETLADFITSTSMIIAAPGLDLGLMWKNLGFIPGVDFPTSLCSGRSNPGTGWPFASGGFKDSPFAGRPFHDAPLGNVSFRSFNEFGDTASEMNDLARQANAEAMAAEAAAAEKALIKLRMQKKARRKMVARSRKKR